MSEKLQIYRKLKFDDSIEKEEYHTYHPNISSFQYNDEIEININQQDIFLSFNESYLYLECRLDEIATSTSAATTSSFPASIRLEPNFGAYLFDSITYELNGKEIEKVRDVGTTTTIKGLLCYNHDEGKSLAMAGWSPDSGTIVTQTTDKTYVTLQIPLSFLFTVFHDYKMIINGKHKIRLVRSRSDVNCYFSSDSKRAAITVQDLCLKIKHIYPSDQSKLHLLDQMNKNIPIHIGFRNWEFLELPSMRQAKKDIWSVKTTTNLERPRYVIVAFQTDRKDNVAKEISKFDNVNITNLRLWLNSQCYPYENQNFDFSKNEYTGAYQAFVDFHKDYHNRNWSAPTTTFTTFKERAIFVIDCSKQNEAIQTSTVDVKLEFESRDNFPDKTRAYCIIIHDKLFEYYQLMGIVKNIF